MHGVSSLTSLTSFLSFGKLVSLTRIRHISMHSVAQGGNCVLDRSFRQRKNVDGRNCGGWERAPSGQIVSDGKGARVINLYTVAPLKPPSTYFAAPCDPKAKPKAVVWKRLLDMLKSAPETRKPKALMKKISIGRKHYTQYQPTKRRITR